ncbi:vigilin [Nephila pilipes]|uniref:Vigilin n=1 Tax=Nephila pilipes TaxID=299642 RepID=A0A8X6SYX0_NEPPI|nr:vigilin [Nephila pilipes]
MTPPDVQSDIITLRGEQTKLSPALTLVYSKANRVKTEHIDFPSWLHNYIIGKKGANIKHMTQDLSKVQVYFTDGSIKVGPQEVYEACKRLKEMIDNLRKQVAYEEVKANPAFHRHVMIKEVLLLVFIKLALIVVKKFRKGLKISLNQLSSVCMKE